MSSTLDATHDPALKSWVPSANAADTDFPVQNLPYGRFRPRGAADGAWRMGVAIGDQVLDLQQAAGATRWPADLVDALEALGAGDLNRFMGLGPAVWRGMRAALSAALAEGSPAQEALARCLVPQAEAEMGLPCRIGDYTDFYVGIHHATTVGKLFRPDNPLLPNYKWVPIGYHGRASSIGVSGQRLRRPLGQLRAGEDAPRLAPTQRLDYELELGLFVGTGNVQGEPVPIDEAEAHLFGIALFNDWSSRDVQAWEYQPLGPFQSKNFASTLGPWIVTMEALAPFRAPFTRPAGDPQPLPYLDSPALRERGGLDVTLEVWLQTAKMREAGEPAVRLSQGNVREAAYWTPGQLVAHHTIGGCNLQPGDLLGSGTLSGPLREQAGSMLELSLGGKEPFTLPNGETRSFLADGDTVSFRGRCERAGARRIGFGVCVGTVEAAKAG